MCEDTLVRLGQCERSQQGKLFGDRDLPGGILVGNDALRFLDPTSQGQMRGLSAGEDLADLGKLNLKKKQSTGSGEVQHPKV